MGRVVATDEAGSPAGGLLGDLGGALSRVRLSDDRAADLMRLSGDPLLVRALLARDDDRPLPAACRVSYQVTVQKGAAVSPAYHSHLAIIQEPLQQPSLFPERFNATDRGDGDVPITGGSGIRPTSNDFISWLVLCSLALSIASLVALLVA